MLSHRETLFGGGRVRTRLGLTVSGVSVGSSAGRGIRTAVDGVDITELMDLVVCVSPYVLLDFGGVQKPEVAFLVLLREGLGLGDVERVMSVKGVLVAGLLEGEGRSSSIIKGAWFSSLSSASSSSTPSKYIVMSMRLPYFRPLELSDVEY